MLHRSSQPTTTFGPATAGRTARRLSALTLVCAIGALASLGLAPAAQATVNAAAAQQLVSGLKGVTLNDLAIARDGTGGLVYTATTNGVSHVFLSRLVNGSFQTPQQLDSGVLTSASNPTITADNGGELLVAFVSGGGVYVSETASTNQALSSPQLIASNASSPSISMNLFGVGYLAYTTVDGSGDDVDVDYYDGSTWAPASPAAMNDVAGDVAGTGSGAPSVWASSDGVGIVAWGENGHVYSRRVWGTATSTEVEQDDLASYAGLNEASATDPQVAAAGDSTYPAIVFAESFQTGSGTQTRAMMARLVAENVQSVMAVDGLSAGSGQNAFTPQIALGELGRGMITANTGAAATSAGSGATAPYGVEATVIGTDATPGAMGSISSGSSGDPAAVPGVFGSLSSGLAWDQVDGLGVSEVQLSYASDGVTLAAPITLSSPGGGPVQPADGLLLGGDNRGDATAVWVQGASGSLSIDTDQLYTPPGTPGLSPANVYANSSQPTLSWNAAAEDWGAVTYTISFNGTPTAATTNTSLAISGVTDGTYSWGVTGTNADGQAAASGTGKLVVDTFAPRLRLRLTGAPRIAAVQRLKLSYVDPPNPTETGATASGVKAETVNWGDGSVSKTGAKLAGLTHIYTKAGLYTVTVTVADEVNNTTELTRLIRVLP